MAETKGRQISAVDIKKLWYCDELTTAPTSGATLAQSATEILNVHQDTWQIEEGESSQDSYKNQLTGATYRMGAKTMGDVTFNFTIGRYDYELKAALMGGEVIKDGSSQAPIGWARARGVVEVKKCLIALTEDDVYCILPCANVNTREANTDGAVGLSVVGTMLEPDVQTIKPEYWLDK